MSRNPSITKEQTERILELRRLGVSNKEIAEEIGCSPKIVSTVCVSHGLRQRSPQAAKANTRSCPKCHRGGFPEEYLFCPYCAADVRSERDKLLELLHRTVALFTPPCASENDSKAHYALQRAIGYLEAHKDE